MRRATKFLWRKGFCIAINSDMNEDGWRVGKPCENIVIMDSDMHGGHSPDDSMHSSHSPQHSE